MCQWCGCKILNAGVGTLVELETDLHKADAKDETEKVTHHWLVDDQFKFENETEVMAHRGASAAAPENSMAAIKLAIESGAQWVEIDVQETADGEIVVIHDSDLKKVGGVPMVVAENTMKQLE